MPCWTVRRVSLDLKVADWSVIEDALKAAGVEMVRIYDHQVSARFPGFIGVIIDRAAGTINISNSNASQEAAIVAKIKKSISTQIVAKAARRARWGVKIEGNTVTLRR